MSFLRDKMAEFERRCRAAGLKLTHQRLEIMRELAGRPDHPDAEEVYRYVRLRIPTISLDTVYRNLRMLEAEGIIARLGPPGAKTRFDADTGQHHHFVCTRCGLVHDVHSETLDELTPPEDAEIVGQVQTLHVEMRGVCMRCQATDAPPQ